MTITNSRPVTIAALGFIAGLAVSQAAHAAAAPLDAAALDVSAMTPGDMPSPAAATPNLRARTFVVTDGATFAMQMGTVQKHFHTDANEVQMIVAGGGTEWLGGRQVALKPGMVLIIPAGTAHGGTTDPNLTLVSVKTPPQGTSDFHPVP